MASPDCRRHGCCSAHISSAHFKAHVTLVDKPSQTRSSLLQLSAFSLPRCSVWVSGHWPSPSPGKDGSTGSRDICDSENQKCFLASQENWKHAMLAFMRALGGIVLVPSMLTHPVSSQYSSPSLSHWNPHPSVFGVQCKMIVSSCTRNHHTK